MTKMANPPERAKEAGAHLKSLRESRGITQTDLAKVVKKNLRTIVRWESGESSPSVGDWTLMTEYLEDFQNPAAVKPPRPGRGTVFGTVGSGKTRSLAPMLAQAMKEQGGAPDGGTLPIPVYLADEETRNSPEGVDWERVIRAHDEVMAYIEMGEEFGGDTGNLRENLPRATMLVYRFLAGNGGRTPTLREMNALMREV